jgi:hypothetical protein
VRHDPASSAARLISARPLGGGGAADSPPSRHPNLALATALVQHLEAAVVHLIDRRESCKKGSPGWEAACESIGKFIDSRTGGHFSNITYPPSTFSSPVQMQMHHQH